jgi:hydroxypyruvate isomerase
MPMPRLAANLSVMFQEAPFLDRFAAGEKCGFTGVENLFPYDQPAEEIAQHPERRRLTGALQPASRRLGQERAGYGRRAWTRRRIHRGAGAIAPLCALNEVGYGDWIGCEYRPAVETRVRLNWAQGWVCRA